MKVRVVMLIESWNTSLVIRKPSTVGKREFRPPIITQIKSYEEKGAKKKKVSSSIFFLIKRKAALTF